MTSLFKVGLIIQVFIKDSPNLAFSNNIICNTIFEILNERSELKESINMSHKLKKCIAVSWSRFSDTLISYMKRNILFLANIQNVK